MNVRPYTEADLQAVAAAFTASVHILAAGDYTKEQRTVWAPQPPDLALWQKRLARLQTLVAVAGPDLAGFVSYQPIGHVEYLYVAPEYARNGVASLLYESVEDGLSRAGVTEVSVESSIVARPFFAKSGFFMTEVQDVFVSGYSFRRYAMRKRIEPIQRTHEDAP